MDYNKLTTDELIEIIVSQIGVPLPYIDYNHSRKYVTAVPMNVRIDGVLTGVEYKEEHDTFKDACLEIITWYNRTFRTSGDGKVGEFVKPLRNIDINAMTDFISWKTQQPVNNISGSNLYDIKGHYKLLNDDELFEHWKKINNYR